jgi:hypothetical protein
MAPHGVDIGVYVRGALSGFAACRRKAKHGLKTIYPRGLADHSKNHWRLVRGRLGLSDRLCDRLAGNGDEVASQWSEIAPAGGQTAALLLPPENVTASNADCPSVIADSRQAWVNLSCHGSDEQMFGAKQQVLLGGRCD